MPRKNRRIHKDIEPECPQDGATESHPRASRFAPRVTRNLSEAVAELNAGRLVAIPTETVYGLAASIRFPDAIRTVFEIKARPEFDPLIVHLSDLSMLGSVVSDWPPLADLLAEAFWPGPLTLVLPKNRMVSDMITAGLPTVGVRMPAHPVALELIARHGAPIAAPSANRFGKVSPTRARHVLDEFKGNPLLILDGDRPKIGIESTIVRVESDSISILRPGMITIGMLKSVVFPYAPRCRVTEEFRADGLSPGRFLKHYEPRLPVVLLSANRSPADLSVQREVERELGVSGKRFGEMPLGEDPIRVARTLYADLREIASRNVEWIAVRTPRGFNDSERWRAVHDRLNRAAKLKIN